MNRQISFNEEEISMLFGGLAAEDEKKDRFKSFFLKNEVYKKIHTFLPLRILVAHKGIGKSAIFRMSYIENDEKNILSLWIRPDDISDLGNADLCNSSLELIRKWKEGLSKRIVELVLASYKLKIDGFDVQGIGVKVLDVISSTFKQAEKQIDLDKICKSRIREYLKNKKIIVYIDDLDRAWEGSRANINRIAALLNAVRDMANESDGLCFRISLRSDVYFLVRTADESTDKIDGNVLWLKWTEHELLVLLAKRIQSFFGVSLSEKDLLKSPQFEVAKHLHRVMEERFMGEGKWKNKQIHYVLLSLIRRRPRDLINLCTMAARTANEKGHEKIETDDWKDIFDQYSLSRLQDTVNEHRYELPDVERLLLGMKPSREAKKMAGSFVYEEKKLLAKIDGIMQKGQFVFANGKVANNEDLLAFMYKINFLVARKDLSDGYIDRKYFEENRYISNNRVDFGYKWEIHPAFRWALYPESRDIFSDLDLPNLI